MDFREEIAKILEGQGVSNARTLLEVPPQPELGDFALPCFSLAKERQMAPVQIATQLATTVHAKFLARVEAKGPYVNFFVWPQERARAVLGRIATEGRRYGRHQLRKERVMVEYSQPNTHKAFHVGHLRGTSLGESISRILRFAGYNVVQANYSGDTGAHIAKWLWYYTTYDKSNPPTQRRDLERWIAGIYVGATQRLEEHPEEQAAVDDMLARLDSKHDHALQNTYERTKRASIDAFRAIYEELGAHFDVWLFEGDVEERAKEISQELVQEGIAKVDDGATIVDLQDENLGVWVLLRKGGTPLYSAKDLALAERKFNEFHIDVSLYVVGAAQAMHMQQLFATLKRMGYSNVEKCRHISFAEVRLPTGKMSSRTGQNILYTDIYQDVYNYATQEVQSRHADWTTSRVELVARKVTIAALKWDMLAIHPNKTIVFDAKEAIRFEGETGPYLQYTHARASHILEKAKDTTAGDGSTLTHEKEQALLRLLESFPDVVKQAAREYSPGDVAHFAMDFAKAFNSFYHDCPVLTAPTQELRSDRVALVRASATVFSVALELLGIAAPSEM